MIEGQISTDSQQCPSVLQVGLAKFKETSYKSIQHIFSQPHIKHILSKQNWRIKDKPFNNTWHPLFQQLQYSLCKRLFIQSIGYQSLLNSIQPCLFTNLTVLNLSHNPITNIQSLNYLNAPNLQFIFLQTNHIISIKTLAKISFKHLEELDLSGNKIQQIPSISRFKTSALTKSFSIELFSFGQTHHHHWHQDQHSCRIQTISMIAKLQHSLDHNTHDNRKKYEMLKRQFDYILTQINSDIKFMNVLTQQKPLKAIQKKFHW